MGWSTGYDRNWKRDIGYGVPAICDHPDCTELIDRGLGYVCGREPYGGEYGCGLFLCDKHKTYHEIRGRVCVPCADRRHKAFKAKPDHPDWIKHKLTDESWEQWRKENPEKVLKMENQINEI